MDWNSLLSNAQPVFDADQQLAHFGNPQAEAGALLGDGGIAPLPDTAIIQVTGDDAPAFLQAQLSQAVEDMPSGSTRLAGYCNPKGRLYGVLQVIRMDGGYLLLTERTLVDLLLKRLRMFVLRSRVELHDVSDGWAVFGLRGERAQEALTELTGSRADEDGLVHRAGDLLTVQIPRGEGRSLVLAPADEAARVWGNLSRSLAVCGPWAWRLLAIRSGDPVVTSETAEQFVPQQINLELVDGVNFRKGCYPGQEVVARMHYLGKPSRRMYRLLGPGGDSAPAPGSRVTTGDGKHAGDVVIAATGPDGVELLAALRTEHHGRQDLGVDALKLGFAEIPYTLEGEAAPAE
ncbi:MAG: folate-binding protein YgfZ [Ectothiorhodospiraceae bacterium]|nr:folate-binding protein YgfZ [Ectothiorhodospiraceae bacterium]